MMKRIFHIVCLALAALCVSSCGIYSFSGTSIKPDVKSITIDLFEYKALKVKMTSLEQVDVDGDLEITGAITGYDVRASAIAAGDVAAQSRLTVTVKVNFTNRKYPEEDFTNKSFSAYADFDAANSLDAVESTLILEIIDKLVEDIFNATVAQW